MHINTPITQQENGDLRNEELFCSKSDADGVITYANAALCRISGFSEQELLGRPHHVMRHPDMPRVVYAWMWDTLKRGYVWHATIKDRCKNGDYYWVDTNISGQYGLEGEIIGYLSTRRRPRRHQIEAAQALYAPLLEAEGELAHRSRLSDEDILELYQGGPLYRH